MKLRCCSKCEFSLRNQTWVRQLNYFSATSTKWACLTLSLTQFSIPHRKLAGAVHSYSPSVSIIYLSYNLMEGLTIVPVCAITSRYYTEKPDLYSTLMEYAQLAAGTALISSQKNVEMCQAYILLSLYPVPARRYEDDRSWLYLGLAIRCVQKYGFMKGS